MCHGKALLKILQFRVQIRDSCLGQVSAIISCCFVFFNYYFNLPKKVFVGGDGLHTI